MGGRLMFPAFPHSRALPWILGAVSLASLIFGFVEGNDGAVALGTGGLAFIALAYGISRLVIGGPEPEDVPTEGRDDDV